MHNNKIGKTNSERWEMLMHANILDGTLEEYGEHRKHCKGCFLCNIYRTSEENMKKELGLSDAEMQATGLSFEQLLRLHETMEHDTISSYYPDKSAIYEKDGKISRETYLCLQSREFTDNEIRQYFGINIHQWNLFKKREFPNWKDKATRDRILSTEGVAAYLRWRKSPRNQIIKAHL